VEVVRNDAREPIVAPDGSTVRELLGPPSGTAANLSLAEATVAPETETVEHFHRSSEELYVFLSGSGRMRLGEDEADVVAGDRVAIPPGTRHKLVNTGAEPLVLLCCCSPPYSDDDTVLCE
jgi:mannose-6-phosphate isomerase-like protein (cupin superfamily)